MRESLWARTRNSGGGWCTSCLGHAAGMGTHYDASFATLGAFRRVALDAIPPAGLRAGATFGADSRRPWLTVGGECACTTTCCLVSPPVSVSAMLTHGAHAPPHVRSGTRAPPVSLGVVFRGCRRGLKIGLVKIRNIAIFGGDTEG